MKPGYRNKMVDAAFPEICKSLFRDVICISKNYGFTYCSGIIIKIDIKGISNAYIESAANIVNFLGYI